jgi:hypothetical protein
MEEMVEPDRTIMIVSIIGIVIIWGSFFYHKFVQGGSAAAGTPEPDEGTEQAGPEADEGSAEEGEASPRGDNRKKGKRRKKR